MKRIFILLVMSLIATIAQAQEIAGDWQGTLNTAMGELRLVLHIGTGTNTSTLVPGLTTRQRGSGSDWDSGEIGNAQGFQAEARRRGGAWDLRRIRSR